MTKRLENKLNDDEKLIRLVKKKGYNFAEVDRIFKDIENSAPRQPQSFKDYFDKKTKIGIFSDAHIGAREFDEPFFKHMINTFKKEGVKKVYNCGDTLEGMSGREGQIYELSEIGFRKQFDKAVSLFKLFPKDIQIYGIDGNHDQWYQKKNNAGLIVGKELDMALPNYNFLGQNEANIQLRKNVIMKMVHPGDGTAYAISYKMQKRVESFTGGEKPQILLQGHYHKALYMFNRNVHGLDAGTMCGQTSWMRGKNIPAHKGFWIVDIEMGKGGIGSFKPAFYAGYK